MVIHHLAIWVKDLEGMKSFYTGFFLCQSGRKYHNPQKGFTSYFLNFDSGAKIELMHRKDIIDGNNIETIGLAHFAISVGSKELVDKLTKLIEDQGFIIKSFPRTTGDGYYESVIFDPEGNIIEITV